jgi:protoporphyrin/coproporphyrin ferrochelatase
MTRTAIIFFNLGGPDSPSAIKPFLTNLFSDPAIIGLPNPFRAILARVIATRRTPTAQAIYKQIGGRSPLYEQTLEQAAALDAILGKNYKTFIAMRYWHPFTEETIAAVIDWKPDKIILLPLYPQFSTTTSGSSLALWHSLARRHGISIPTVTIKQYPDHLGLIEALVDLTRQGLASATGTPRVLFSAHGLPESIVKRGDPYPGQVERTARAVAGMLSLAETDWVVCYQSRVGPLTWIGPSLDQELERAAQDRVPVVVVPIAFVSEHSETLVELDIEYRHRAEQLNLPGYVRVPTVRCHPAFIAGLADLVRDAELPQDERAGHGC